MAPDLGVIFDMDGVLVDSAAPHFQSWQQLAREQGRPAIREEHFKAAFGRANRDIIPIFFGETSPERVQALADRKEAIYRNLIRENPPLVAGAADLIQSLDEARFRLAVGSSAPIENIRLILGALGAANRIRAVVSGDDVSRGKPDPEVFLLACRRLALSPGRCVVIEDAPVGIEAARRAGTKTIAVLMQHPEEGFHDADLVVPRLSGLRVEQVIQLLSY